MTIKQNPHRTIDVSADEEVDIDELYSILTKLEKLLMMMDGRFHIVVFGRNGKKTCIRVVVRIEEYAETSRMNTIII